MTLRKNLILRRSRSGRLERRTTVIQFETETPPLGGSGATPALSAAGRLSVSAWCEAGLNLCALTLPPLLALVPHGAAPLAGFAGLFSAAVALAAATGRVAQPRRLTFFLFAGTAIGIALAGYDLASAGGLSQYVSIRPFAAPRLNQIAAWLALLVLPAGALLICRAQ